ncbi:unnamed protein product [Haemonchus placei]|uniref:Uncharacterized protein n=1 Tax=Haemonchus placei TaxID=6290 RepID=A0A3P7SCN6_HAEPC|nr:unnamed protein product [Haemonchus placei]
MIVRLTEEQIVAFVVHFRKRVHRLHHVIQRLAISNDHAVIRFISSLYNKQRSFDICFRPCLRNHIEIVFGSMCSLNKSLFVGPLSIHCMETI